MSTSVFAEVVVVADNPLLRVRIPPELMEAVEETHREAHDGKRGGKSKIVRNALREYLGVDQTARIEKQVEQNADRLDDVDEKLDEVLAHLAESEHEHTRTTSTDDGADTDTPSTPDTETGTLTDAEVHSLSQGDKAARITQHIRDAHLGTTLTEAQLRDYADEVAGVGDRSFDSYREVFKNKALLFEDPRQDTDYWYTDREEFFAVVRDHFARSLDDLRPDDPDDPRPDGRGNDHAIIEQYGGDVAAAYRAYRVVAYLREHDDAPFDAGRIPATATMFENYVFDQQPNTYEPEVYTGLLVDECYLRETEDGESYELGENAPDPDDSDAGGDVEVPKSLRDAEAAG